MGPANQARLLTPASSAISHDERELAVVGCLACENSDGHIKRSVPERFPGVLLSHVQTGALGGGTPRLLPTRHRF